MSTDPLDPRLWYMADPPRFEVRSTANILEWVSWREKADVRVARTNLTKGVYVSTVFLGSPHLDFFASPGVVMNCLFETMVFGLSDELQDKFVRWRNGTPFSIIDAVLVGRGVFQRRYRTVDEARLGHKETVDELKKFLATAN